MRGTARLQVAFCQTFGRAGLVVAARVIGAVVTLFYTVLLTGIASPHDVGLSFTAISLALVLSVIASLNIEAGSIRFLPLYLDRGRMQEAIGFMRCARYVTLGAALVFGVVALGLLRFGFELQTLAPFLIALLAAPVLANTRINSRHAVAMGLVVRSAVPRLLVRPVLFALVLLICHGLDVTLRADQIMLIFLAAVCVTAGLQWVLIRSACKIGEKESAPRFDGINEWMSLGLLLVPMLLLSEHMRDIVILSASFVLPPAEIARLGIALSLVGLLTFALTSVDMVLSPRISRAILDEDTALRDRLIAGSGVVKLAALLLGAPIVYSLIPPILSLMSASYQGVQETYLLLVPMALAMAVFGPGPLVLNVLGKQWELFATALFGGLALMGGVIAGGLLGGLDGAAVAISLAVSVYHGTLYSICRTQMKIDTTLLTVLPFRRAGVWPR